MKNLFSRNRTAFRTHTAFRFCVLISASAALALGAELRGGAGAVQFRPRPRPDDLGVADGMTAFQTPQLLLKLVKDSQTAAALKPNGADGFDFSPSDRLNRRWSNRYYQLGDITFRVRNGKSGPWTHYSTALNRKPVHALTVPVGDLAAADLGPTLPSDCPLKITRIWKVSGGHLELLFKVENPGSTAIEIGSLGIPMVFNNILTGRSLQQANEKCSFSDPYIGEDGGYLQVTRLSGAGPALVVAPVGHTPFEAYRLLREPTRPEQTAEGMFDWLVHTRALANHEWKGVKEWNRATMATLQPHASRTYGVEFLVSKSIRGIDHTLEQANRPVAIGIPGYILPMGQDGKLFFKYSQQIRSFRVEPAGSLEISGEFAARNGWRGVSIRGKKWGRSRLVATYTNGLEQTVNYYVTKPAAEAVHDLGHFLFTKQWFDDLSDPFHRAPSVISYDRQANHQVLQDGRVWIAGLSDEAGAGSWLAAAMKEFGHPNPTQVSMFEQFVDHVLWGHIQYSTGPNRFGVRKSVFYYDPKALPNYPYSKKIFWGSWTSWNKVQSEDFGRGYDYPHVIAAYWAMYRIARNHPGLVKDHPWQWFLNQAYQTVMFLTSKNGFGGYRVGYVDDGLMEGDVLVSVLKDLKREGWSRRAAAMERRMKQRTEIWLRRAYPFGSEMAWDSTGQEEVYAWCTYFGRHDKALVALNSIIGYMPTLPSWAYNGNARRYWDFLYAGKLTRIERMIHHYGSGINAIPVLREYRMHPNDFYLLRVGYGGAMGALSSIDQEGFASCAFHSYPSTLHWDAYSGDYGTNFFGHTFCAATYLIDHPDFGWQAFGGNVYRHGDWVGVRPLDSLRQRLYIAPLGLWLKLDAGRFVKVEANVRTHIVRIALDAATRYTLRARLRIAQPASIPGVGTYQLMGSRGLSHGAYPVKLGKEVRWVVVKPTRF